MDIWYWIGYNTTAVQTAVLLYRVCRVLVGVISSYIGERCKCEG
jgi:hypothetical protein